MVYYEELPLISGLLLQERLKVFYNTSSVPASCALNDELAEAGDVALQIACISVVDHQSPLSALFKSYFKVRYPHFIFHTKSKTLRENCKAPEVPRGPLPTLAACYFVPGVDMFYRLQARVELLHDKGSVLQSSPLKSLS